LRTTKQSKIGYNYHTDPLCIKSLSNKVQVKDHPDTSISSENIQIFSETLKCSTDFDLFVIFGSRSAPAVIEARYADEHTVLIDFTWTVNLWQEYNAKMPHEY